MPLQSVEVRIQAGTCGTYSAQTSQPGTFNVVAVSPTDLRGYLRQSIARIPTGQVQECRLDDKTFSVILTRPDQTTRTLNVSQFLKEIREIVF